MSVEIKKTSKTPKFKIGDSVIVRFGEEPRIHRQGIILSLHQYNRYKIEYAVKFPDEKLVYFYLENRMHHIHIKPKVVKDWDKWKPYNYDSLPPFQQLCLLERWILLKKSENAPRVINVTVDEPKIVGEITKTFKDMHLTPVSPKHREYMTGYIDCAYEYTGMTSEQRDELYKKMGIE